MILEASALSSSQQDILESRFYRDHAACKGLDPEDFVTNHRHEYAAKVCGDCPVAANCFFEAVVAEVQGTWGGVYFPPRSGGGWKGRPRRVSVRNKRVAVYRSALAARLGMTRERFLQKYGESVDGMKSAIGDVL